MPRIVTVSDVRRALLAAGATEGMGAPTHAELGSLFHEIFAGLTGNDESRNLVRPLERADLGREEWSAALEQHAYGVWFGQALAKKRGQFDGAAEEVLQAWTATRALCAWIADLMWNHRSAERSLEQTRALLFARQEQDLSVELQAPGWSAPVELRGRFDALMTQPATRRPCIVELKTGRTSPEADLAQVVLYRKLHGAPEAHVAVLAFTPDPRERVFAPGELLIAEARLLELVGRLAEVVASPASSDAATPGALPVLEAVPPAEAQSRYGALARRIEAAFAEFDVRVGILDPPQVGPAFLRFRAEPGRGVGVKAIQRLENDLWNRLGTEQPPLVSMQRGRLVVDVPRPDRAIVPWGALEASLRVAPGRDAFPVGVAVDGSLRWARLGDAESAHLLVAGTNGSGKSEWLRSMLASLMAVNTPESLQLLLIDPKRVAFMDFAGSRWLRQPVISPDGDPLAAFAGLIAEMERRYALFERHGVSDLAALTGREPPGSVPRIVVACDEYANLFADRKQQREIELCLARLASKARAAGIHVVLATQRPDAKVITGVVLANLTGRVALRVASALNSRLIIEHNGAASLLGRGDLLYRDIGDPVRLQAPLVTAADLRALL